MDSCQVPVLQRVTKISNNNSNLPLLNTGKALPVCYLCSLHPNFGGGTGTSLSFRREDAVQGAHSQGTELPGQLPIPHSECQTVQPLPAPRGVPSLQDHTQNRPEGPFGSFAA